jgi:hypothetical protein
VVWPAGDAIILALLVLYSATALVYIGIERSRAFGFSPRRLA